MYQCKNCGAYLDPGEICDCVKSREERAMAIETMQMSLKYMEMLGDIPENDKQGLDELNEAFRVVATEIAEKYGQEPKEFMSKVIDALEEFADEV